MLPYYQCQFLLSVMKFLEQHFQSHLISQKDFWTNLPRISGSSIDDDIPASALSVEQQESRFFPLLKKHFLKKATGPETGQIKQKEIVAPSRALVLAVSEPGFAQINVENAADITPTKLFSKPRSNAESSLNRAPLAGWPLSPPRETAATQGSPSTSGPTSTSEKFLNGTPVLQPSKRCYMCPDDALAQSPDIYIRRPSCRRPLKFDNPVLSGIFEDDIQEAGCSVVDSDVLDVFPENLIQSGRNREALLEQVSAISPAECQKQMLGNLPKVFDLIYFYFHSITRRELMQKIVSERLDVVDEKLKTN